MGVMWFAVMAGALIVLIDGLWRALEHRGVQLGPVRRRGSLLQTAIAAGAVVLVAWILEALGILGPLVSSPEARVVVLALIVGLQIATALALAMMARRGGRAA